MISNDILDRFSAIVGAAHAIRDQDEIAPHLMERRGLFHGASPMLLRPGTVAEVAAIMALATETKTPIVPQSANTGHVGGQIPRTGGSDLLLTLTRMNRIREIDLCGNVMVVDAGSILQTVQDQALAHDRLFPLSLGSQGSCQIGGNLATNAGGTATLAYGNMRNLCLGLEVVLPTGEIWDGLRRLKKDNSGYDLRDLFIGSEGTLGVITGAVLKLFPRPLGHQVAFVGVENPAKALQLFEMASRFCGPSLTGFELIARLGVEFATRHIPGIRDPLREAHPWYVLVDISTFDSVEAADRLMAHMLETALDAGIIRDGAVASSESQAKAFWHLRESLSEAQRFEGGSIKHDISVPIAKIPLFLEIADRAVLAAIPDARICAFGHMGDGNIHYNISQPARPNHRVGQVDNDAEMARFIGRWKEINALVHEIVIGLGGSISAEHGIGQLKREDLAAIRPPIELDLMRRIKKAFDPAGIMNPGKVL